MRSRVFLLVLLLLSSGRLAQVASARPQGLLMSGEPGPGPQVVTLRPVIEIHGDRLSVRARNAPWDVVLQELEQLMGARVHAERPLPGTLTQEFEAMPLEQGLRRLFRDANYVFLYAKGAPEKASIGKLAEIWLLPKAGSAAQERQPPPASLEAAAIERRQQAKAAGKAAEAVSPDRETKSERQSAVEEQNPAHRLEAVAAAAKEGDTEALREALLDPDPGIQARALELLVARDRPRALAVLVNITKSGEPSTRLQALSRLHAIGQSLDETDQAAQGTVLAALGAAVADEDMSIKSYAIEALAGWGKPNAMVYLRQAYSDPDPFVRTMVIENVAMQGQNLQLLEKALSDADETVRSRVTFWLKQMDRVSGDYSQ